MAHLTDDYIKLQNKRQRFENELFLNETKNIFSTLDQQFNRILVVR
jgi:hypothetical protein